MPKSGLREQILDSLSISPGLTAEQLRDRLFNQRRKPSVQAVYAQLRILQRNTTVVKVHKFLYLSYGWVLSESAAAEERRQTYFHPEVLQAFLPAKGKRISWTVTGILKADQMSVNLMLAMAMNNAEPLYNWDPLPWCLLFNQKLFAVSAKALATTKKDVYVIVGPRAKAFELSKMPRTLPRFHWWKGSPGLRFRETEWLRICGPFILRIRYPSQVLSLFNRAFAQTNGPDAHEELLRGLLNERHRCHIKVENSPNAALKFTRMFHEIF